MIRILPCMLITPAALERIATWLHHSPHLRHMHLETMLAQSVLAPGRSASPCEGPRRGDAWTHAHGRPAPSASPGTAFRLWHIRCTQLKYPTSLRMWRLRVREKMTMGDVLSMLGSGKASLHRHGIALIFPLHCLTRARKPRQCPHTRCAGGGGGCLPGANHGREGLDGLRWDLFPLRESRLEAPGAGFAWRENPGGRVPGAGPAAQ
jgi:hypothetical protein